MRTNISTKLLGTLLLLFLTVSSCTKDDNDIDPNQRVFGIFKVLDNDTVVEMNGVIGRNSLKNFNKLHKTHSKIRLINIRQCDGSDDDETNLKLSKKVHDLKINTHLMDNATIASGGVDFFLAGVKRSAGSGTRVGVHSWSNGSKQATDFPVGHTNHQPYIKYYISIGFAKPEAEAFYYFTINAASANGIHWMTTKELKKHNIFNQ